MAAKNSSDQNAKSNGTSIDDEADGAQNPTGSAPDETLVEAQVTGADDALSGEKRTIFIHVGQGDDGAKAVFLAINGYGYNIPRNVRCRVPVEVVEVLRTSIERRTRYEGSKLIDSDVPRYAYTVEP